MWQREEARKMTKKRALPSPFFSLSPTHKFQPVIVHEVLVKVMRSPATPPTAAEPKAAAGDVIG